LIYLILYVLLLGIVVYGRLAPIWVAGRTMPQMSLRAIFVSCQRARPAGRGGSNGEYPANWRSSQPKDSTGRTDEKVRPEFAEFRPAGRQARIPAYAGHARLDESSTNSLLRRSCVPCKHCSVVASGTLFQGLKRTEQLIILNEILAAVQSSGGCVRGTGTGTGARPSWLSWYDGGWYCRPSSTASFVGSECRAG